MYTTCSLLLALGFLLSTTDTTVSARPLSPGSILSVQPRHRLRADLPSIWTLANSCVQDGDGTQRLLSTKSNLNNVTVDTCLSACDSANFNFAGVQYGQECWCGNSLNKGAVVGQSLNASQCDLACNGDASQKCGGCWALTLFQKSGSSSSSSPSPSPSPTSLGSSSTTPATSAPAATTTSAIPAAPTSPSRTPAWSEFRLVEEHSGSSFFDKWTFFTGADPTNGFVNYVSKDDALSSGLAYVDQATGLAVMKIDSTTQLAAGANRNSVRISSTNTYNQGLMLFDIVRMPFGCSIWPALWTVGYDWPNEGEIDIIEGVNNSTMNQMTLHTGSSTSCNTNSVKPSDVALNFLSKTCASSPDANSGCAYQDPSPQSFGHGFNEAGGAVFALLIDQNVGTKLWRFQRANVPSDVTAGNPNPDSWGTPSAFFPTSDSCQTKDTIQNQQLIFDMTICGGWAGAAYTSMGCGQSCSERVADPVNFQEAVWNVRNVTVWQHV
ncbi:concanavalin A-like lectin/glucanase domain-containing protein [Cantharellus anzutake]|uniref:concanavalin A-like lectin/glucanase domain-containing protein n=1 Tax=Cantharellus anzutake TaxID=1750568 RepID=UPI0019042D43|nr:concanavalin A-like lectin/glucanase domain-containing protein [Cantharellus anzutake]KAF8329334.1 concanavalin A-like lectin/glucanase domain-containing protein [Cantharellus anzutake]